MPKATVRSNAPPSRSDEPIREIELPRDSGTHGDVLAAVGLAELLGDAARDRRVRIENRGASFAVVPSRARRPSELTAIQHTPGYKFLQSKSAVARPGIVTAGNAIDYQATRDEIAALRLQESELHAKRNQTRNPAERQRYQEAIDALRQQWSIPPQEWRRYPPYLVLQGHETANKLLTKIVGLPEEEFRDVVQGALSALASNQPTGVAWDVSTVQLFSPNAAKGYARLKPDSTGRGDKTKDAWADPFVEWLRYRGYFSATVPVFHGSKGEHIRVLAPIPGNVTVRAYQAVVAALPTPPRGASPPKIDSLATLDIARLLIERSEMFQRAADDDERLELRGRTPDEIISGLAVTNFQSLGSARAVSSMTELAVPGWFRIRGPEDAVMWLAILDEHKAIVRGLEDSHSDELSLLLGYRRFLEQRGPAALDAFLDFAGAYGNHVFRVRDTGRRIRQFTADLFGRVVVAMEPKYAPILDNDGFKAVAAAVRRATVSAMTLKSRNADHRDIRYGLLPELRRARALPGNEPLLVAVADFIDLYNAENARRQESNNRPWHGRVTTEELVAFTSLVDEFNANIVGALLCAYGTCTERREPSTEEPDAVTAGDADATNGEIDASADPESTEEE